MDAHVRLRIDGEHAPPHDLCLLLSHRIPVRYNLPIQICDTDFVIVNQIKGTHAAADQRFADISAHTTYTEHRHSGLRQFLDSFLSQQPSRSCKLIFHSLRFLSCA